MTAQNAIDFTFADMGAPIAKEKVEPSFEASFLIKLIRSTEG